MMARIHGCVVQLCVEVNGLTEHQQGLLSSLADFLLVGPANINQLVDAFLGLEDAKGNTNK